MHHQSSARFVSVVMFEVRPFESEEYYQMIDYFRGGSDEFLAGMGVDRNKIPAREDWFHAAWRDQQLSETDPRRDRFFLAWVLDGEVVGHSSINRIKWGQEAYAHLHLWRTDIRKSGIGAEFFRRSVSIYFERFNLQVLYCEPYAENPAPNRVLSKLGFTFIERYRTTPGPVNFEQDVNRYEMKRADWLTNHSSSRASNEKALEG